MTELTYRNLTDKAKLKLKNPDYSLLGKLYRIYTIEFIMKCLDRYPDNKLNLKPKDKIIYLAGICRSNAQPTDYQSKGLEIESTLFSL